MHRTKLKLKIEKSTKKWEGGKFKQELTKNEKTATVFISGQKKFDF